MTDLVRGRKTRSVSKASELRAPSREHILFTMSASLAVVIRARSRTWWGGGQRGRERAEAGIERASWCRRGRGEGDRFISGRAREASYTGQRSKPESDATDLDGKRQAHAHKRHAMHLKGTGGVP
jgi:hypothetical protein